MVVARAGRSPVPFGLVKSLSSLQLVFPLFGRSAAPLRVGGARDMRRRGPGPGMNGIVHECFPSRSSVLLIGRTTRSSTADRPPPHGPGRATSAASVETVPGASSGWAGLGWLGLLAGSHTTGKRRALGRAKAKAQASRDEVFPPLISAGMPSG